MTEKRLAISLFILFALSAAYLFAVNERGLDPDQEKNWWSLSFAEPANESSLVFIISNHTATDRFHYAISNDGNVLIEGELSIEPGNDFTQVPSAVIRPTAGRVTITVTHEGREETIYRSL